jgi:hypothetical protein
MNIVDFTKQFQINKEFLDTIDFIPFLKQFSLLGDMMVAVEEKYRDIDMPNELEGEIFNYYTTWEFEKYLEDRYSNQIQLYPYEDYLINFIGEQNDY